MKKVLISLLCISLLVVGCNKPGDKENKKAETAKATSAKVDVIKDEGLDVTYAITEDNKVVFTIKNNGKEIIDNVLLNIAYFDKDEQLMSTSNYYTRNLEAGKQSYVVAEFPRDYVKYEVKIPDSIKVRVYKEVYGKKSVDVYTSKVTATNTKTKNDNTVLNITVTNNSGVILNDVELTTLFYKGDKIVGAAAGYVTNVGKTETTTVSVPFIIKGETGEALKYDKAETVVNSASKNKAA